MTLKRYTFVANYDGGVYVSQHTAIGLKEAIEVWGQNLDSAIYSEAGCDKIIANIDNETPTPLTGLENVWCCCFLPEEESLLLVNIIETAYN